MNKTIEVIEQDQSSYWPEFIFGFGADEDAEEGDDDNA
jgi:hypothetical protein